MKVLIADGDSAVRESLSGLLAEWGYEAVATEHGAEATALLQSDQCPRLAILDWTPAGIDGVEICRQVRGSSRSHYIYILLLTARTESQDIVMGMEAGADDYITKPFNPAELRARLWAGRRILQLQEQLVRAREALREQATRDGLTGLWNRITILEILDRELSRASREHGSVSVVMADLDYFKQINDLCGHIAGDTVLRQAAQRMHANVRQYDSIGRYGGEEFLIVLPGCDLRGGMAQAERMRAALAAAEFALPPGAPRVSCSVGVASATDVAGAVDAHRLVREADAALYLAKRNGRNRVEAYSSVRLNRDAPAPIFTPMPAAN
jgi:two-component system cell cycle response regulator